MVANPPLARATRTSIAVCALTLDRPVGLRALLDGLAAQELPHPDVDLIVVIIDNEPSGGARAVVDSVRPTFPWELRYAVESTRGIPFGRNRAVQLAGTVDFVAFLDDDEVPDRRWLAELLAVQRSTAADVVTGTVLPHFEHEPAKWVLEGGFFDRPRFATGTEITYARTSNVLIGTHVFPAGDGRPFNEAMGLNGGDDTHFFMRARLAGHRIVWADDAIVVEDVPRSRVNVRWLLRREYRRGNTLSLCLRDLVPSRLRWARRAVKGTWQIATGLVLLPFSAVVGRAHVVRALRRVSLGAGYLSGLVGMRFDEYTEHHGT